MAKEITITGEIIKMLDRTPFHPFTIILTSGDRFRVTERHQIAVGQSVVILIPPNSTSIYMRANQIAALEEIAEAA